ncbi:MAG: hypothetical protein IKK13_04490, partial [Clostridia bacterium]|nr:hypothetical protein [Clostridia bacterium]
MAIKYKVSDAAKDFGIASKDITAILEKNTGEAKKSGASLQEHDLDIIFEVMTVEHQVKNFDEYFKTGEATRKAAADARKADKDKKLAEQMALLEQLKAAAEAEQKAKEEAAKPKAEPKKAETPKAEPKKEVPKKAEEKPAKEAPKAEKPAPKKDEKPMVFPPKKEKTPGAAPNRGPAQIRHVDTRTVHVDMEKYNEKYESIAPANSMGDNYSRKQKI